MPAILRPLSLGLLLDETFDIYRRNFLLFLGISAIPYGALLLILILFDKTLGTILDGIGTGGYLGVLFTIVAIVLVPSIVTAATTFAVSDIYLERPTSIRSCFSRVSGRTLKVVAVSFMVGLTVGLGCCCAWPLAFTGRECMGLPSPLWFWRTSPCARRCPEALA
jgi:uncharacterized membrane protein YdcZ (DUF606 family)